MNDLLKTDKELLLDFIKQKHWVKTSDVIKFGVENYSNRADRNARQLAKEGKIKRMSEEERKFRFGNIKEGIYEYIAG